MEPSRAAAHIDRYLNDHARSVPERERLPPPSDDLGVCLVIPAYDERERIAGVIDSLDDAAADPSTFETIVVVNNPADAPDEVVEANLETIDLLRRRESAFDLHVIDRASPDRAFPPEAAGVGHARRIAMDLAVARLARADAAVDGLIGCLDGDSPAARGYVDALLEELAPEEGAPDEAMAGVCRYRHPIPDDPEHAAAIVTYESWMRYFELGLHHTGTPFAYTAIGSCMVLTAVGYALADGVPTREALSDFYLLQKVTKVGGRRAVRNMREPLVYPSARPSGRVPRGTGPSVRQTMQSRGDRFALVEPPSTFGHLRDWFAALPDGFANPELLRESAAPGLESFLSDHGAWNTLPKLRETAPTPDQFVAHVHQWFDSLKIVKYGNVRRRETGGVWLFDALRDLLDEAGRSGLAGEIPDAGREEATLQEQIRVLELLREHELDIGR